jgi:hypothetical protein
MSFRIFLGRRPNTHVESAIELYLELNLLQSSLTNDCKGDGRAGLDMCPWKIVADVWLCTRRSDFVTSKSTKFSQLCIRQAPRRITAYKAMVVIGYSLDLYEAIYCLLSEGEEVVPRRGLARHDRIPPFHPRHGHN